MTNISVGEMVIHGDHLVKVVFVMAVDDVSNLTVMNPTTNACYVVGADQVKRKTFVLHDKKQTKTHELMCRNSDEPHMVLKATKLGDGHDASSAETLPTHAAATTTVQPKSQPEFGPFISSFSCSTHISHHNKVVIHIHFYCSLHNKVVLRIIFVCLTFFDFSQKIKVVIPTKMCQKPYNNVVMK